MTRRVVVTGAGVISSLGDSWQAVQQNLQNRVSGVRYMEAWDTYDDLNTRLAAPVVDRWRVRCET